MAKESAGIVQSMLWTVTTLALFWSACHFVWSGIRLPLDHPNLGKFEEEASPLGEYLSTGGPVHSRNPEQYGPVFFFVMHPLLGVAANDLALANGLYALQLVCIAGSFLLTCATLKLCVSIRARRRWPLAVAWLAVIWGNFSPLYAVVATKSVETWELLLLSLGLYAFLREWRWTAALAVAAAGLVKVLPFVFLYYFLITDRRTFVRASIAVAVLLLASHVIYGPEMGLGYLPRIVAGAVGNSYGLNWHENVSLKAALAKLFGHLPPPSYDAARTSGYYLVLTGWRRAVVIGLGDALVIAGLAALSTTWLRLSARRSRERTIWEWSLLAVVVLILSPNTIFEYATLALGAVSYAFVSILFYDRRDARTWFSFVASLYLLGGVVPRQWLNRLTMIDVLNRWTGLTHLTGSEAYQYYCFPLVGLTLLTLTIWRLRPSTCDLIVVGSESREKSTTPWI